MPHQFNSAAELLRAVPATLGLIVLSVAGFLLVYLQAPVSWISLFTYSDFLIRDGQLLFLPAEGQYWRLLTPVFLHFGWLHIAFNSLWTWELGALIEQRLGGGLLLLLVALCGIGSNMAQFYYGGPALFGGMSGVVYALLGFCWVYNMLSPGRGLAVPQGIIVFMLVWLVLCMVVPTEMFGFSIANAAHLGGLLLGCAAAVPLALWRRRVEGGLQ
ncbi:MAG: rhomboid family intramembrane serine protease [Halieaceae bacterium]